MSKRKKVSLKRTTITALLEQIALLLMLLQRFERQPMRIRRTLNVDRMTVLTDFQIHQTNLVFSSFHTINDTVSEKMAD